MRRSRKKHSDRTQPSYGPPPPPSKELREDGSIELREDSSNELRE
jgi:hypothetical protein